jgi:hypothetical protein
MNSWSGAAVWTGALSCTETSPYGQSETARLENHHLLSHRPCQRGLHGGFTARFRNSSSDRNHNVCRPFRHFGYFLVLNRFDQGIYLAYGILFCPHSHYPPMILFPADCLQPMRTGNESCIFVMACTGWGGGV